MTVHRGPTTLTRLLDGLGEPTRRRTYEAVRQARRPVSRVQVAELIDITTRLAAFHLDRLVEEGLLVAHYARPAGRPGGPGAGRPTKWYAPTAEGLEVSLPPRRNDIAARIFLQVLATQVAEPADAVVPAARRAGAELAGDCRSDTDLEVLLTDLGYEPTPAADGGLDLLNCPFHELVNEHRHVVCSMNLSMLDAAATQARSARVAAFEPRKDLCCVRLRPGAVSHNGG